MRRNILIVLMAAICLASAEVIMILCNDIEEMERAIAEKDETIANQEEEIEKMDSIIDQEGIFD